MDRYRLCLVVGPVSPPSCVLEARLIGNRRHNPQILTPFVAIVSPLLAVARCSLLQLTRESPIWLGFALVGSGCLAVALLEPQQATQRGPAVLDFTLGVFRVFGAFVALWWSIRSWEQELAGRTLYVVLSKPVSRAGYLWARYAGLVAALLVGGCVLALGLTLLMLLLQTFQPLAYLLLAGMVLEWCVLAALALLFVTVTAPVLAWLYVLSLFILGHFANAIRVFAETEIRLSMVNYYGGHALYYVLPHFDLFERSRVLYLGEATWGAWAAAALYCCVAATVYLLAASWSWEDKELA